MLDQGIVFSGHTLGYLLTQKGTIEKEGSWANYKDNFGHFTVDNDNTTWNLLGHTYTGSQVYLYYRARGYVEQKALFYSFLSSFYFETLIETYTERPSFQDTFNTPFFGSTLGYVFERVSVNFINSDNSFKYYLGRLINPFSYLVDGEASIFVMPTSDATGGVILWSSTL
tara:strand:+ start:2091 stop:2600 length:510 start_codon:yes stop_codon:yes gene_type:complete